MKNILLAAMCFSCTLSCAQQETQYEVIKSDLRASAYPLITRDRVPMSDWIFTDKPNYKGFKVRSVVGGYFIKMLDHSNTEKK